MAKSKKAQKAAIPYYLRPREAAELEADEKQQLEQLKQAKGGDKERCVMALKRIEKRKEQLPPDLNAAQRDKAEKLRVRLEEDIKEGMLSHEEMRRNPDGAVDRNMAWLRAKKDKVRIWQNLQVALNKGISQEYASDLCNPDRLRPVTSQLNMQGAQIPQQTSYYYMNANTDYRHEAAMIWDEVFPEDEEKAQLRKELEEWKAKVAAEKAAVEAAGAKTLAEQAEVIRQLNEKLKNQDKAQGNQPRR